MVAQSTITIKKGQVWMVDLGQAEGSEQGNIRPCLIVSNDKCNIYSSIVTIIPLTTKDKKSIPTHVSIEQACLKYKSIALVEQIRTVSKERMSKFMGTVENKILVEVDKAIEIQLELHQDRAYDVLRNIQQIKSIIKDIGVNPKLTTLLNNNIKMFNKYCQDFNKNPKDVIEEYKLAK